MGIRRMVMYVVLYLNILFAGTSVYFGDYTGAVMNGGVALLTVSVIWVDAMVTGKTPAWCSSLRRSDRAGRCPK